MEDEIKTVLQKCYIDFIKLINSDKYISKKEFDNYLDSNKDNFEIADKKIIKGELVEKLRFIETSGYKYIDNHNKDFIDRKLVEYKSYFDNMFNNVDSNIKLDEEQRKAILIDEDYSLVIAGAGSGKTTTMAAKVKYLIEKRNIDPEKIILLAFTNKAADELSERINIDFNLNVEVLTFHKLGMKFIRKMNSYPTKICGEGTKYSIISRYIKENIFHNKIYLKKFYDAFNEYLFFDDEIFKYNSYDEYYEYYKKSVYERNKHDLKSYNDLRIENNMKRFKTINGEFVKSKGEFLIANFLYRNRIPYKYEEMYPYKVDDSRSYSPDFTIYSNGNLSYIEYYGLVKMISKNKYSVDDIESYKKTILKKRFLHSLYNTDLIELYYKDYESNSIEESLEKKLNIRKIPLIKRTEKEIFERLMNTAKDSRFYHFIKLVNSFIDNFKQKGYDENDFSSLLEKCDNDKIKSQLEIMKDIYVYYEHELHSQHMIDFNDMINYAYKGIDRLKEKNNLLDYDYVIIDEYQDISMQRYNLVKKLSDLFGAKILAVGDDWQSIYGFSGSDIELFTKFYKVMGYAEITKITKTYRNSQELIDIAGDFVSKNVEQFKKSLISDKHLVKPIEIHYYIKNNIESKYKILKRIISIIAKKKQNSNILILGRYNSDIKPYIDAGYFKESVDCKIICKDFPNIKIDFLTIHKSKGLGYDNVILINALNTKFGFPSQIETDSLLKILDVYHEDIIEYPEERRLFYVALTRTKNKLYVMCPYYPYEARSQFIREIINENDVLEAV